MLKTLLQAQDNLARLESATAAASLPVREGLLARLACQESAGWLAHQGVWIHPIDIAMRAAGITGSLAAAQLGVRLPSVLPLTVSLTPASAAAPQDRDVTSALRQCVLFERLATLRTWQPPGEPVPEDPDDPPPLLAAARLIAASFAAESVARAAWLWRERGGTGYPGLLFWSAPVALLHRAAMAPDPLPLVVAAISEAAARARRELARLQVAEARLRAIGGTRRSRMPDAAAVVLRRSVITAGQLAAAIGVSSRAASGLIARMVAAKVLREATGRRSWRGFVVGQKLL